MASHKIKRLESDIERYLGDIILNEVNDEIFKNITITGVNLSSDLSYCKIYFTSLLKMDIAKLEKEVNDGSSFIRGKLSQRLEIRHTPILKFIYDKSISYGEKIENIIKNLEMGD